MKTRYSVGPNEYKHMDAQELRDAFLVDLFGDGELNLLYCEADRAVVGAAAPGDEPLVLEGGKELAAEYFCERREVGALNLGGAGIIEVDGQSFSMANLDCLYIGRGSRSVVFKSENAANPARYHLVSYPAHAVYPTKQANQAEAQVVELGSDETASARTIYQYIHENGVKSCQLMMGFTQLKPGSVWNTMPCHTHERRTEIYLYFGFDEDARVFHFMGKGDETRHIVVAPGQAVVSPVWSIHSGCGTQTHSFCWAMGGENQRFDDMDHIPIREMK